MSLYSKLDKQTILQLSHSFDIGQLMSYEILVGGIENTNHLLITSEGKYVLTLCERKTKEEALFLANLLQHLANNQFFTTRILPNKNGQFVSFYQQKPILLKNYLEGKIIDTFDTPLLVSTGKNIALLNQIVPLDTLPTQFSYGKEQFQLVFEVKHPFVDWLKIHYQYLLDKLNPNLPKALIHGDIFTSNIIVTNNKQPIIMDFEEACYYFRIFDIGMASVGLCTRGGVLDWDKVQHIVNGYETISPLNKIEKNQLNLFIFYAAMATAFWRFRQFNFLAPTPLYKDHYKEMQGIAVQVLQHIDSSEV